MSAVGSGSRRGAVIIGIDTYPNMQDKQLHGAKNDANEISMRLEADGRISKEDLKVLINEKATCQNIRNAVDEVVYKQDNACELIYFYFAGHGFKNGSGIPHFAPYDFSPKKHYATSIPMKEIRDVFTDYYQNSPAKNKTVCAFIDCCYGGSFFKPERTSLDSPQDFANKARENLIGDGVIGLASMDVDEKTREKGGYQHPANPEEHTHGIFTYHLLRGLEGLATEKGAITFNRLRTYMQEVMQTENQQLKLLIEGDAPLLDVEIAVSLPEVGQFLIGLVEDLRTTSESDLLEDFDRLKDTARKIREFQKTNTQYQYNKINDYTLEVKNHEQTLNRTLEKSRQNLIKWLDTNISQNDENKDLIKELYHDSCPKLAGIMYSLTNVLHPETIVAADEFRRCLLHHLYIVLNNNSDAKTFIKDYCKYCIESYFRESTSVIGPPKPSTSPGAISGTLEGEKTEPKEEDLDE